MFRETLRRFVDEAYRIEVPLEQPLLFSFVVGSVADYSCQAPSFVVRKTIEREDACHVPEKHFVQILYGFACLGCLR